MLLRNFNARTGSRITLAFACLMGTTLFVSTPTLAQDRHDRGGGRDGGGRDGGGRGGGGRDGGGRSGGDRSGGGQDRGGRDSGGRDSSSRSDRPATHNEDRIRFTRSYEGRRFDNGVALRHGTIAIDRSVGIRFGGHGFSYPHYAFSRVSVDVIFSPFHFYYGCFPPFIYREHCFFGAPGHVFVEIPIYVGGVCRGYPVDGDDYYLYRHSDDRWRDNPELRRAVYDMQDAFHDGDITLLAPLTDPATKIAIFARGHFEYSIEANDYLDMTRDFMRNMQTTDFNVYRVRRKSSGIYQVFVKHTYHNQDGQSRMVYLCMVLEQMSGRWTLTQVDTSPDRLEN